MSRNAAMILGILGGAFGIFFAFGAFVMGADSEQSGWMDEAEILYQAGFAGVFLGILGIIGAMRVDKNNKSSAILMLISAITGIFFLDVLWALPFVLLLTGGLLALRE